jgi:hypothetical protein
MRAALLAVTRVSVAAMRAGLIAVLICVIAAGCGANHRPRRATAPRPSVPSPVARAQATHEYPAQRARPETATGQAVSPVQAIRAFTTAYINWNAQTVAGDMRTLAAASVGQARAAMTLAAAGTASDYELRRGGIANSGTVEAIAPLTDRNDEYVVVTRESTTATATDAYQGLAPAWHLALATVVQLQAGGWVLTGWQPEN